MPADRSLSTRPTPSCSALDTSSTGVNRTERRRRQRDEQHRVLRHRVRHALATTQAGGNELVGIGPVGLRTARTDRRAAIAAAFQQRLIRLQLRRVDRKALTGLAVHGVDAAPQPDRTPAAVARPQLRVEARPMLRVPCALEHLRQHDAVPEAVVLEQPAGCSVHGDRRAHDAALSCASASLQPCCSRSAVARAASSDTSSSERKNVRSRTGVPPSASRYPTPRSAEAMSEAR